MERNRNQIFCLLAVQSTRVDAVELSARVSAFMDAPSQDFARRVVESGLLSDDEARRVSGATESLLSAFNGDATLAMASLTVCRDLTNCDADGRVREGLAGQASMPATRVFEGAALREALRRTKSLSERLNLLPHVVDVCRAIGVAHGRGITHRGLHPDVIAISEFGECIVRDWSLCKMRRKEDTQAAKLDAALDALRSGKRTVLDPAFLAPELALGNMESVDARSDVYALGAVLYEILTGQPPFAGEDPGEVLSAVASKKPEAISEIEPTAPTDLVNICERAMHQEPSARYASAKHLAEEIERSVMSLPKARVEAASPPLSAGTGLKRWIALALALLVLVIWIATIFKWGVVQERDRAEAALREEQQKLAATQEAHDKLVQDLEDARNARREAEAERDKADAMRQTALENAHQIEERLNKTQTTPATQHAPRETAETTPAGPAEVPQQTPQTTATPVPSTIVAPPNMPARFLGPYARGSKGDAGQRPPGITKAELAKALPQLESALKMEEGQGGKMAVMVGTPGEELVESLQKIGFKGGDVITNINRSAIEDVNQAKNAFDGVKNDSGFTVRIVRDGQSSWMRINVFDHLPKIFVKSLAPAPPKPAEPSQQVAPESPATPPEEAPATPPEEAPATPPEEAPEAGPSSAEQPAAESSESAPVPASPDSAPAEQNPSTETREETETSEQR